MLDEAKYAEVEAVLSQEISNLSWLHKAAPGFPAEGSKVQRKRKILIVFWRLKCGEVNIKLIQFF